LLSKVPRAKAQAKLPAMAMSPEMEISHVNLLSRDAQTASESEHEGTKGVLLTSLRGGGNLRRSRIVVAASLVFLAASTAAYVGLRRPTSTPLVQKPEPITIPPYVHHQNLPDIEELFASAKSFHPDLDQRIEALAVEHHLPNLLHNHSAVMEDHNDVLRKMHEELAPKINTLRSLEITSCFADSWQLILQLGQIVTNIKATMEACAEPYPENLEKRSVCASMVSLNLAMWMYMGTFICNMWSSCPGVFSKNATCALGPIGILSSSFTLANAGATMATNCKQGITTPSPPRDPRDRKIFDRLREDEKDLAGVQAFGGGRRLHGMTEGAGHAGGVVGEFLKKASDEAAARKSTVRQKRHSNPTRAAEENVEEEEEKVTVIDRMIDASTALQEKREDEKNEKWAIASCVLDTQLVVARLLQAATFIGFAALDCKEDVFKKRGHQAKDKCVIDIGIIVASLAIASNMIAISIINCPHTLEYMPNELCASGICGVISAAGYVAVAFGGIHDACDGIDPDGI